MVKYTISNGIGKLQSPVMFYIKDATLTIECAGAKVLRLNHKHPYPFVNSIVTIKDVTPGVYHFDVVTDKGAIVPCEPIVVANGINDFKGALLVHLQAEALDKRIDDYEARIAQLESAVAIIPDLRATINANVEAIKQLNEELKRVAAGWDPTISENA